MGIHFDSRAFTAPSGQPLELADAFKWSDFARAHGIPNEVPPGFLATNAPRALALLQRIYAILGTTGEATSLYRGPVLNARVGGKISPPSAHLQARAVDSVPHGISPEDAFEKLRMHAAELGYDQLIVEHDHSGATWLHSAVPQEGVAPRLMAFALAKDLITDRKISG